MSEAEHYPLGFNGGSLRAHCMEMYRDELKLAHGTCFIVWHRVHINGKCENKLLLFTAQHNASGLNFFSRQCLNKSCATPNKLKIYLPLNENPFNFFIHEIDLENEKIIHHPEGENHCDVIAFNISAQVAEKIEPVAFISTRNMGHEIGSQKYAPADDLQILGFPFERQQNALPVWMSGNFAYEPSRKFPYTWKEKDISKQRELPAYLINAKTFSGQSGSPVMRHHRDQPSWCGSGWMTPAGAVDELIGIYTCRLEPTGLTNMSPDLGLVWGCEVLEGFFIPENF